MRIAAALITVLGLLGTTHRRVRRLRAELEQALHQAHHDQLTGLPNRESALAQLASGPVDLVGLLDLDDFKNVNDRFGHQVGDEVLVIVSERLRNALHGQGMAARLAGDEFLVIWPRPGPHPIPRATALLEAVCAPITIDGHRLRITASLGLARHNHRLNSPALVIGAADQAMYEAKRREPGDDGVREPHACLYVGTDSPTNAERELPGRRATRDHRPADDLNPVFVLAEERETG